MTKILLLFFMNYILLTKISHAQDTNRGWPNAPPVAKAPTAKPPTPAPGAPTPVPTNAPTFDSLTPKCYPETATAYFLPAPPFNLFEEVPATLSFPPPSQMSSRVAFPPPPPCSTGLPDLMDEIPSKTQERMSRLAESKEKTPVCESCAALIKKLPIFKLDQELLDGFLTGIGI